VERLQILHTIREEEKRTRKEQTPRTTGQTEILNVTHPQTYDRNNLSNPTTNNNTWPIQSAKEICTNLTQNSLALDSITTIHTPQPIPLPSQPKPSEQLTQHATTTTNERETRTRRREE